MTIPMRASFVDKPALVSIITPFVAAIDSPENWCSNVNIAAAMSARTPRGLHRRGSILKYATNVVGAGRPCSEVRDERRERESM